MKSTYTNALGGIAGAVALNIIHQVAKHYSATAPRIDKIGEEALSKTLQSMGKKPPAGKKLFLSTLAADVIANAIYYHLIGKGNKKNLLLKGAGLGLMAGVGALTLTKPLGLDDRPVNKSRPSQLMTVAWYTAGGLVAALTMKFFSDKAPKML